MTDDEFTANFQNYGLPNDSFHHSGHLMHGTQHPNHVLLLE